VQPEKYANWEAEVEPGEVMAIVLVCIRLSYVWMKKMAPGAAGTKAESLRDLRQYNGRPTAVGPTLTVRCRDDERYGLIVRNCVVTPSSPMTAPTQSRLRLDDVSFFRHKEHAVFAVRETRFIRADRRRVVGV
jgi:hypothetical protein